MEMRSSEDEEIDSDLEDSIILEIQNPPVSRLGKLTQTQKNRKTQKRLNKDELEVQMKKKGFTKEVNTIPTIIKSITQEAEENAKYRLE